MFLARENLFALDEFPLKAAKDKRLLHYDVVQDSTIFIMACHDSIATANMKTELKSLA
jgi:hypothetical protein